MSDLVQSFPLALGTSAFGTDLSFPAAAALLDAYVDAGGNHLDTAHDYASWIAGGQGASERTIGAWLRMHGGREKLIIATKVGCTQGGAKRIQREIVREELTVSLERLGIPRVDLLWLHRDDPAVSVESILSWFEELRRENLIGAYGASNWASPRLAEAADCAFRLSIPGFIGSQCGWNLAAVEPNAMATDDTHFLNATDELWHQRTQVPLVAFEAQAGGFFSGRYRRGVTPNTTRADIVNLHYANSGNWRRLARAEELATKYHCTPNQIALAWLRSQPFQVIPIIGPKTVAQLFDSLGSINLNISPHDLETLKYPANVRGGVT